MEQLIVFHKIFHDDLSPTITPSYQKKREYKEFLSNHSGTAEYDIPEQIGLLPDHLLRFYFYKVLLAKNVKEIQLELYQSVFIISKNEDAMKNEVARIQRYISMNINKIKLVFIPKEEHHLMQCFSDSKSAIDIYKLAYNSLVDLHEYLDISFQGYLHQHILVPCKQRKRFIEEQRPKAEYALNAVNNFEIADELKTQVSSTIERFLNDGFDGFTYSQMDYCKRLNSYLNRFFQNAKTPSQEDFVMLLIQLNFNRNGVLKFSIEFMNKQAAKNEVICDQLETLSKYLKMINSIQHLTNFGYNENLFPLREQLQDWLDTKMCDLSLKDIKEKKFLTTTQDKQKTRHTDKLAINLSVDDAALLLKVFFESGLLNMNKTKAFEYFASYFKTANRDDISQKSVKNNFYNTTEKNIRSIRNVLNDFQKSLDTIEKNLD